MSTPNAATKRLVRETLQEVTYSTSKNSFRYRRVFFYKMGGDSEKVASAIIKLLGRVGLIVDILSAEEHWNRWPKDSFWEVTFRVH